MTSGVQYYLGGSSSAISTGAIVSTSNYQHRTQRSLFTSSSSDLNDEDGHGEDGDTIRLADKRKKAKRTIGKWKVRLPSSSSHQSHRRSMSYGSTRDFGLRPVGAGGTIRCPTCTKLNPPTTTMVVAADSAALLPSSNPPDAAMATTAATSSSISPTALVLTGRALPTIAQIEEGFEVLEPAEPSSDFDALADANNDRNVYLLNVSLLILI